MIIDFHTHAFSEKIVRRAMDSLMANSGGLLPCTDGTVPSLQRCEAQAGVNHCVVLNIATKPSQQRVVNDFAISLLHTEGVIPFGSVHPLAPDALDELDRIAQAGLPGIKLHPDYQHFYVDDDRVLPVYEKASALGLITVFHSGVDIGFPQPVHCTPLRLSRVLSAFTAPVVAAHLGGWLLWDEVETYLCGTRAYLDTSFLYGRIPPKTALRIIQRHGSHRVLFGSDAPWGAPAQELRLIQSLPFSEEDKSAILGLNAARLLRLV